MTYPTRALFIAFVLFGASGCGGLLSGLPTDGRPWVGVSATGPGYTAALQGDETASLAAGKTFAVKTGTIGGFVELPLSRGPYAGVALRVSLNVRITYGELGAVTLGELEELAPGLATLVIETARRFDRFSPSEPLSDRGSSAFDQHLADTISLTDVGADLGFLFVGAGPRFGLGGRSHLELGEVGIGGFLHISGMQIALTDEDTRTTNAYLGLGMGLTLRLAPFNLVLDSLGGGRIQPLALSVDLFGLLTEGNLRAIVVTAGLSTGMAWSF